MSESQEETLDNFVHLNYQISKDHGFFDEQTGYTYQLLLIGTEIAEALESVNTDCDKRIQSLKKQFKSLMENLEHVRANGDNVENDESTISDADNLEEELADILIRVFSLSGYLDEQTDGEIKVNKRVPSKMMKNNKRPYKHDKNF